MAKLARLVVPGLPHHVTQRGNHREPEFFYDGDYAVRLDLVGKAAKASGSCSDTVRNRNPHGQTGPAIEGQT